MRTHEHTESQETHMNSESATLATTAQDTIDALPRHEDQHRERQPAPENPTDILVIAEQPAELQAAQAKMVHWANGRVAEIRHQYQEAEAALRNAKERNYPTGPFRTMARKMYDELVYYEKMRDALQAGYCIIPNMPVEIIAIRVERARPEQPGFDSTYTSRPGVREEQPDILPSGDGRMVDPIPKHYVTQDSIIVNGNRETKYRSVPTKFQDPRFPIVMRRTRVIQATNRAIDLKCFDQIGVLPKSRRQDPIVLGQIKRPSGQLVSFLVAWWIDTAIL